MGWQERPHIPPPPRAAIEAGLPAFSCAYLLKPDQETRKSRATLCHPVYLVASSPCSMRLSVRISRSIVWDGEGHKMGNGHLRIQCRCNATEAMSVLTPFHIICTPMQINKKAHSRMITFIAVTPMILDR